MRAATFVLVVVVHACLFALFPGMRSAITHSTPGESPSIVVFLPLSEPEQPAQPAAPHGFANRAAHAPAPPTAARTPRAESTKSDADPEAISPTVAPDWRAEAQEAARHAIKSEYERRNVPSLLAPHDFSGVRPGGSAPTKPRFQWDYAATHRLEALPGGGFLWNINDRCAVAVVIMIVPFCRIGKMTAHGNLFEHMDKPAGGGPDF